MNELDKMFEASEDTALPPIVRYCKGRMKDGDQIQAQIFPPRTGFGTSRTELFILLWPKDSEPDLDNKHDLKQVEWDDGINLGLVDLGIRAVDLDQEARRFSLMIRGALRIAGRRYGDGYSNAVMVKLIDDSDLAKAGEVAEVRQHVSSNPPEWTRSHEACRELIADGIGGRAVELRDKLKYKPEEVRAVMTKALATYLDERFSVSNRRLIGLL